MQLIDIGFGNRLAAHRVLAVVRPDSMPVKTMIATAREQGRLIDATMGRKTASVVVTDSGHVVLSYLTPERVEAAMAAGEGESHA